MYSSFPKKCALKIKCTDFITLYGILYHCLVNNMSMPTVKMHYFV